MDKEYSHTYGDTNRITYVYYNPAGYDGSTYSRDITVKYVDLSNNKNVLKSETVTVTSESEELYTAEESFSKDGVDYVICGGQSTDITLSYFSTRSTYTLYYRDVTDDSLADVEITYIYNYEREVIDLGTRYVVTPANTQNITVVAQNTETNETEVIQNEDENGEAQNENTTTIEDENGNETDITIDGYNVEDIETPTENVDVQKNNKTKTILTFACATVLTALIVVLILKKKNKEEEE